MVEVDRVMIEDLHITLSQMMENAGHHLAELARQRFFGGNPVGKSVVVLAGKGGNGGGAMVCARHLHNRGSDVRVVLAVPKGELTLGPAMQLHILQRMQLPIHQAGEEGQLDKVDLIVDGLIGYHLSGAPRSPVDALVRWANKQKAPILALDIPTGVDATTGEVYKPAIRAAATMTLGLPKTGMRISQAVGHVGELYLADISVPPMVYQKLGLKEDLGSLFAEEDILKLD